MICERTINIDMDHPYSGEVFRFHEGDVNGSTIRLGIFKDSTAFDLSGCTAKYDAVIGSYLAEANASGTITENYVTIPVTGAMTAYPGNLKIDVRIIKNDDILFFQTLRAYVQPRVIDDSIVTPEGEPIADFLTRMSDDVDYAVEEVDKKMNYAAKGSPTSDDNKGQLFYTDTTIGVVTSNAASSSEPLTTIEVYSKEASDARYIRNPDAREDYCNSLPPIIYTGLNGETRIYYRNLLTANYLMYWGQYTNATTIAEKDDYVSLVGTAAATKNVAFKTFDRGYREIESGTTSVVINSNPPANQTMLMLGDSFIDLGYIEPDLRSLFTAAGRTLTLIGTRGTGANKHEGYSGWKYTDFVTDSKAASNPFWNSGTGSFDFSYYMSQQGYSGLNSVFIQLGTNDAKPSSIQADFTDIVNAAQTIVSSILSYNSQIKIYLGLTVMPTLDCDSWAPKYNGIGVPWLLRYNMQRLNAALINAFKSNSSVKIVATNCILDSVADISDNVHPNSAGFQKMAQQLYYTMML